MADDDIVVGLSANIAQLLAGFNTAAAEITATLGKIESQVSAASTAIEGKMAPAAEHAAESLHHMHEESEGLGGTLEDLKGKFEHVLEFTGAAIAFEVLEKIGEKLEELADRALEFNHAAESLGVSVTTFQGIAQAANDMGLDVGRVERVMFSLTQRMDEARQKGGDAALAFNKLGISNQDLGNTGFTAVEAMQQLGSEANSNTELIGLLGARMASVIPLLREMSANHNLFSESAKEVNALLPSEVADMIEFYKTMDNAKDSMENFLTRALIPAIPFFQQLIEDLKELSDAGPVFSGVISSIGEALGEVIVYATTWIYRIKLVLTALGDAFTYVLDAMRTQQQVVSELAHGQFADAMQTMQRGALLLKQDINNLSDDWVAGIDRGNAAIQRMKDALSGLSEIHPNLQKEEMPKQLPVGVEDDTTYMAYMKDRIKIHEDMISQELKDDEEYLTLAVKNAQDIARGVMEAQLGQAKQSEALLNDRAKVEMFGNVRELDNYKQLIDQKLEAQIAYLDKLESLAAAEGKDTEKYESEKIKATQAAALERTKAEQKAAQDIRKAWDGVFKPIEASFTDNITKMIEGTESFGQAWRNILSSILDTFIKTIANMVVQWLLGMLENLIIGKTTALSQISANAGVAATAAMASVAAIPFVGWAMAPEVGAATYGTAMAYSASIASAAGGYDIPAGINPQAQLHEKEMVLPAHIADPLRQMISGGGGGGPKVALNVHQMDSENFMIKKKDLLAHIENLNRRFAFGTKGPFK